MALAPGLSNFTFTLILPTSFSALSSTLISPSKCPKAIQSIIPTLALPMNLSFPTCSLSMTSISSSFSVDISKSNSWFQTGFLPPCACGLVACSCPPIFNLTYGSAFPNIP